jgi:hypothetical protein
MPLSAGTIWQYFLNTSTQLIFDTNGLCNANDAFTLEQISSQITSTTSSTQFIDYFNNCFKTRMNNYVRQPNLNAKTSGQSIVFLFFSFLPPYCLLYSIHCALGVQTEITGSVQGTSGVKVEQSMKENSQ